MNVRNCRKCGKLFNYISGVYICPQCKEAMEGKFQEVKAYINEHGTANLNTVAEECDVEIGQLKQWVKEERLTFADLSVAGIVCESCGVLIKTGRFCDKCKNEMARGLSNAIKKEEPKNIPSPARDKDARETSKMRFLNSTDRR